jgi:hypothetical protein
MKSSVFKRMHLLACVIAMGIFVPCAEGATIVKSHTSSLQSETSSKDKAAAMVPGKAAELAVNVSVTFDNISQIIDQFEYRFQAQGAVAAGVVSYKGTLSTEKVMLSLSGQKHFRCAQSRRSSWPRRLEVIRST